MTILWVNYASLRGL